MAITALVSRTVNYEGQFVFWIARWVNQNMESCSARIAFQFADGFWEVWSWGYLPFTLDSGREKH
jgi:hypothetical protein